MEKIKLEILGLSSSQSQAGSFALVLGEVGGKRRLPIIIGMFEAQAIAIEIEKISPNRPMTHDLFLSFAESFNFQINEIIISNLREGVFFAQVVCTDGIKTMEIDARPSDAIAIGLRFNVPIYTVENIMSEAGIILSEEDEAEEILSSSEEEEKSEDTSSSSATSNKKKLNDYTTSDLEELLNDAINNEDYEAAAKIRDELSRRN